MIENKIINEVYLVDNKPQEAIKKNAFYLYKAKGNAWYFTFKNDENEILNVEIKSEDGIELINNLKSNTPSQETQIELVSLLLPMKRKAEISIAFDYVEHYDIGQSVQKIIARHFAHDPSLQEGKITLATGIKIEISELYAIMGDFFGLPDEPIASKNTLKEQKDAFFRAFNSLNNAPPQKIEEILKIGNIQKKAVSIAMQNCKCDSEQSCNCAQKALGEVSELTNKLWNKATGGSFYLYPLIQGDYLKLSKNNLDHFSDSAHTSYKAGHELALELIEKITVESKKENPDKQLISQLTHQALGIEASAGHYLTDSFSSGHTRIPRKALYELKTLFGLPVPAAITGLFTLVMHNEDGANGLWLKDSATEDVWKAYGDDSLLTGKGQDNRFKVCAAAQTGMLEIIGEIKKATLTSSAQDYPERGSVYGLLPTVAEDKNINQPLFKVDDTGQLLRRKNVNDILCTDYINNWGVLTTLLVLLPTIISSAFPRLSSWFSCCKPEEPTQSDDTPNEIAGNSSSLMVKLLKGSSRTDNGLINNTSKVIPEIKEEHRAEISRINLGNGDEKYPTSNYVLK